MSDSKKEAFGGVGVVFAIIVVIAFVFFGSVAGCGAFKNWQRGQARANAENSVKITHILIQKAQQQADINYAEIAATKAEAQKRYQEAVGIRRAQDEISRTLTPLYIQHEAIQAEEQIATSGSNNTVVYVPSGNQGVPLVQNATNPSAAHP